jgi:hypothetical protein
MNIKREFIVLLVCLCLALVLTKSTPSRGVWTINRVPDSCEIYLADT